jgi:oligopeptidase A
MTPDSPFLAKLPLFDQLKVQDMEPMISAIIQENLNEVDKLLKTKTEFKFDELILPLQALDNKLASAFSPIRHLHAVKDTPELREVYNAILPKLTDYQTKLCLNETLYHAYEKILNSPEFSSLKPEQQQIIRHAVRDFKLAGVALPKDKQPVYAGLQQKLAQLQTKFEQNVLDSTDNWHHHVSESEAETILAGVPERAKQEAQQRATQAKLTGFRFGLDYPSYSAIMTFANDRDLREIFYEAYATRASEVGPNAGKWDNSLILSQIIQTRQQLANLLGFKDFTYYSLATKMAKSPNEVLAFLSDLAHKVQPMADKEYQAIQHYARQHFDISNLAPWDIAYVSEKMREAEFNINQEQLRPYFPEPKVLSGLFAIVEKLYPITIQEKKNANTWDISARLFEIKNKSNELIGQFYIDLYARPGKRSGAWMDECRSRYKTTDQLQLPVAYLTCNFSGPVGETPALFTHQEVITLFHEFGHGLHHMLTQMDYLAISGITGVPWDAVEVPSQFLENWCWEEEALALISGHYQTQEPLSKDKLDKLKAAKDFQTGLSTLGQLEYSLFDFMLHQITDEKELTSEKILALHRNIRAEFKRMKLPEYYRFAHSFGHIFAGGYAAGYYSYMWAEVMACDAFSCFEEEGIFNSQTGSRFLNQILAKGGSQDFDELFLAFRGRQPNQEAFLKHRGIV